MKKRTRSRQPQELWDPDISQTGCGPCLPRARSRGAHSEHPNIESRIDEVHPLYYLSSVHSSPWTIGLSEPLG